MKSAIEILNTKKEYKEEIEKILDMDQRKQLWQSSSGKVK